MYTTSESSASGLRPRSAAILDRLERGERFIVARDGEAVEARPAGPPAERQNLNHTPRPLPLGSTNMTRSPGRGIFRRSRETIMPGRPRTMLRRVERLEVAAYELANAVFQTIPEQYRPRRNDDDYIAEMWREALDAAIGAWGRTADLGEALREKAGIPGYGPTVEMPAGTARQSR